MQDDYNKKNEMLNNIRDRVHHKSIVFSLANTKGLDVKFNIRRFKISQSTMLKLRILQKK